MNSVKMISHNKGYQSRKLHELCGFPRIPWDTEYYADADIILNWGVQGKKRRNFIERYGDPVEKEMPWIINWNKQLSKFQAIKLANDLGVRAPHSVISYQEMNGERNKFIYKPFYSIKGKGIYRADQIPQNVDTTKGYYQQYIDNRAYELRVTALSWVPRHEWGVWKKEQHHAQGIAWNHAEGGRFVRVKNKELRVFSEAKDMAEKLLRGMGWDFGAVDFLVDVDRVVWFIEVNSRPGFQMRYDGQKYIDWFNMLKFPGLLGGDKWRR